MGIHAISWWLPPPLPFKDQATQSLHLSPPARVKYKHVWNGYSHFTDEETEGSEKTVFSRPGDSVRARIETRLSLSPSSMPPP